jgi:hypothetical protein
MIDKIINNQTNLKNIYNKLDKLREVFDFNNPTPTFKKVELYTEEIQQEIRKHFSIQEQLKNKINPEVDKIILENMLVKEILIRISNKILEGAKSQNIDVFNHFDDFYEILKAYMLKERGLFIQQLNMATTQQEKKMIKSIIDKTKF